VGALRGAGPGLRSVAVIGTGLIGTSVALALRARGTRVLLADRDPAVARLAADLGAGTVPPDGPGEPADLALIAVPPAAVAATLLEAQKRGTARAYTDVASVKELPLAQAAALGCDLGTFVGGHPLGGRERSGPLAARPDLFLGRPWVLCPTAETGADAIAAATGLALGCGGSPVTMDAADHDRAMALISHAPHVVSSAMAARFAGAAADVLGLAGQGARDVTRIAGGDPALWYGILSANAHPVADVIDAVARDLARTAAALRAEAPASERPVTDLLKRGEAGHGRIPGKHGGPPRRHATVHVLVADRPGELALVFHAASIAGVNIEDFMIEHTEGRPLGMLELAVEPESAELLAAELRARGWAVPAVPE
jgi:prephenate dehydrogenase